MGDRSVTLSGAQWTCEVRFEAFDGHSAPVLRWRPRGEARAHAVFFPPYGDEMNQTRRMYRLTAEALATNGIASCLFDLTGTGDSSADFTQASVGAWLDDCRRVLEPLARQAQPLILIGCRLGAALAVLASGKLERPAALLIAWAPLWLGSRQLSGLLRAARLAKMARAQEADAVVFDVQERWSRGEVAWLAGYPVSARLADGLRALDATQAPRALRAALFDLRPHAAGDAAAPGDALRAQAQAWTQQGVTAEASGFKAQAFWNVVDLVDVPELVGATVQAALSAVEPAGSLTGQGGW